MATPSGAAGLSGNYRISTGPTFFRFKDLSRDASRPMNRSLISKNSNAFGPNLLKSYSTDTKAPLIMTTRSP